MEPRFNKVRCWQVSELNNYLKELLNSNPFLNNLWIKGEISNLKKPGSGHLFFTVKDQGSSIKAVMFKSRAGSLLVPLKNGMEVLLRASLSIYERDGIYQLYVEEVQPLGIGDLHKTFELLKEKLLKEGLFDTDRKKPLPKLPLRIGLVTSLTGAVIQDMLRIFRERLPKANIIVSPAAVQGPEAPEAIVKGIKLLNRHGQVDLIVLARGGGSLEELWAFNTEIVAREISSSKIPVISAVGHETDFTIADLVADLRAPTPTAAAVIAVPDYREEFNKLNNLLDKATGRLSTLMEVEWDKLKNIKDLTVLGKPEKLFAMHLSELSQVFEKAETLAKVYLEGKSNKLYFLTEKIDGLSPLKVLRRGYAICQDHKKTIITSVNEVEVNQAFEVRLKDGYLDCLVQGVKVVND
ncbi:MAG: exodeoxyribonuclease VII large subunit [Bacillota bacterium]